MSATRKPRTSEVGKVDQKDLSTSEVLADTLTLDEYLNKVKVNPGLVTSYKHEAAKHPDMLVPKTVDDWAAAFYDQAHKVYE